jgi:alpha-L-fucosidase
VALPFRYEPTWESVAAHPLPDWYDDAKLGVFIHWGLYSVPGWAPQVPDIQQLLREKGPAQMLRDNPYAEWYLNSSRLTGSPTWHHQRQTYGLDATYDDFVPAFDDGTAGADMDAIAAACRDAGAGYVVLTTKHHDGFCLWPTGLRHPRKGRYHARRDLVGELRTAVLDAGMRIGLYYSGGYDWPYNDAVLKNVADSYLAVPDSPDYVEYASVHVRELIGRYQPSVLWNDICWPAGGDLPALFADYYNAVPDGVINDRWIEPPGHRGLVTDALARLGGLAVQRFWSLIPDARKSLTFPADHHFDFRTPEYAAFETIQAKKWESTRGVGHSFGANRNERPEDIVTGTELVRSFADIVSKNGNLLIGVGPDERGHLPAEQLAPLRELGSWLRVNGEAIYATRPWETASSTTTEGSAVRFTQRDGEVYAILLDLPMRSFGLRGLDATAVSEVRVLGLDELVDWQVADGMLNITLPQRMPVSPAHVVALGRGARPA